MTIRPGFPLTLDRSSSTEHYFRVGNYTTAAMVGRPDEWQTWAAFGLIGHPERALSGLSAFLHIPLARFYLAVSHWIAGHDAEALRLLEVEVRTERLPSHELEHARRLLGLISKPQIQVLSQLPWKRGTKTDILSAAKADSRFVLRNIGPLEDDLPVRAYADVHAYYQEVPDFYLCVMAEYQHIPPNLETLACPILAHTADFDLNVQCAHPWLRSFDELVVTDGSEWEVLRPLVDVPVSTMPKCFGIPGGLYPPGGARALDLYASGTLLHPYYPDKSFLTLRLLELSECSMELCQGFLPDDAYFQKLGGAKLCVSFTPHVGATLTRALEAFSAGCAVLVPSESVFQLYASPEQGLLTFDVEHDDVRARVREILADWPRQAEQAARVAEHIHQHFRLETAASQYLRFHSFLATRPRAPRPGLPQQDRLQKRSFIFKGWFLEDQGVTTDLFRTNLDRLQHVIVSPDRRAEHFNELMRETFFECYLSRLSPKIQARQDLLDQMLELCREGCDLFPKALVLRYNLIRTVLHLGRSEQVPAILTLLDQTLKAPRVSWQVKALDYVLPWDYEPYYFNQRVYLDCVNLVLQDAVSSEVLVELLLASLHYYRAHYAQPHHPVADPCHDMGAGSRGAASSDETLHLDPDQTEQSFFHFRRAHRLDPSFSPYALAYARALLERATHHRDPDALLEAAHLLEALARDSLLFQEATLELERLAAADRYVSADLEDHRARVRSYRRVAIVEERDLLLPLVRASSVRP